MSKGLERNEHTTAITHSFGRVFEGAPEGLGYHEGEFFEVGSPTELGASEQLGGNLADILYKNRTSQVVALEKTIHSTRLSEANKQALIADTTRRIDMTTRLAIECLKAAGIDTTKRSGISLMHYPGGPLVVSGEGRIYRYRRQD